MLTKKVVSLRSHQSCGNTSRLRSVETFHGTSLQGFSAHKFV
ncbi:hypothetical protein VB711_11595 [Cronbergia sp. UHCC 0137]|nr:hypothetical protein [Cronbergia sp. UHCC 0137]MEA5618474.1 hypothetical protein [Cronbergia sp. UHCC 0137]